MIATKVILTTLLALQVLALHALHVDGRLSLAIKHDNQKEQQEPKDQGLMLPRSPLITHYQMGVQHIELTGVLQVNATAIVVTILTFLKTCRKHGGGLVCWNLFSYNLVHCQNFFPQTLFPRCGMAVQSCLTQHAFLWNTAHILIMCLQMK